MLRRTARVLLPALAAVLLGAMAVPTTSVALAEPSASESAGNENKLDQLIFLSGRVVNGELIEETATEYVFRVHYGNLPPVETRYRKSEVLELKRNAIDAEAKDDEEEVESEDEAVTERERLG